MMDKMKKPTLILQLKISLKYSNPLIWRTVQIPADYVFDQLHDVIQIAFAWEDAHLYQFTIPFGHGKQQYVMREDEFSFIDDALDAATSPIKEYIHVGDTFSYVYDMGDNWEHEILCEALLIKPARVKVPRCIDGAMNHAFEDVGGIGGYYYTLEALKDPKNPDHKEQVEWLIECFGRKILKYDMSAFDPVKIKF